jgi:hypothetical protein
VTVIFLMHIKRGFGVPAGDFLRGLLHFYCIELVHLAPNSITIISTFIHLCEAYLGIAPHFHLWRQFFELKKTGKGVVVGSVGFMLCRNMKSEYIDLTLPDNTTGWKLGWFYLDNPTPVLRARTGQAPIPYPEWTNQLASWDTEELHPLLDDLKQLKAEGLTGAAVAISFCRRLIQPLQIGPTQPSSTGGSPTLLGSCSARSPRRRWWLVRRASSAGRSATGSAPRHLGYTALLIRYVFDLAMFPS